MKKKANMQQYDFYKSHLGEGWCVGCQHRWDVVGPNSTSCRADELASNRDSRLWGLHKLHKSRASDIKFAKSRKLSGRRGRAKVALLLEIPRKVVG